MQFLTLPLHGIQLKAKMVSQTWRKLWPAIMTAQGASEEEDFTGFNDCNKDTVCEMVSVFEKLNLSNLECEKVRYMWKSGSRDEGIAVSHTTTDGDFINAVMNPD
jgi:hypothetical protein